MQEPALPPWACQRPVSTIAPLTREVPLYKPPVARAPKSISTVRLFAPPSGIRAQDSSDTIPNVPGEENTIALGSNRTEQTSGRLLGTDFDLYLYQWTTDGWVQVAQSVSATPSEVIRYVGSPGSYIWGVLAHSGSGSYELWLQHP